MNPLDRVYLGYNRPSEAARAAYAEALRNPMTPTQVRVYHAALSRWLRAMRFQSCTGTTLRGYRRVVAGGWPGVPHLWERRSADWRVWVAVSEIVGESATRVVPGGSLEAVCYSGQVTGIAALWERWYRDLQTWE